MAIGLAPAKPPEPNGLLVAYLAGDCREQDSMPFVSLARSDVRCQGAESSTGRFGQPRTPTLTSPSTRSARTDGVLATSQETLGAVDGVNRPDSAFGASLAVARVNEVEHGVGILHSASQDLLSRGIIQPGTLNELPDLISQRRINP